MTHGLDNETKKFVRNKVQQLGSISAVNKFYHQDCFVDRYARQIAREIYAVHNNLHTNSPAQITKSELDREAYLAALERKKERDKQSGGIPEYEEGTLRSEWGTREEHKKMRASDWGDMQKRRKE